MNKHIGSYLHPYIISEIGVNHGGNMDLAKKMIKDSALSGAHAAKFQTYKAETLAAKNSPSYWDLASESTTSQYALFKKYDAFGPDEYRELSEYCMELKIDFISTPFDLDSVDVLDSLMKYFKVASADITNTPLLRKIASKKKPVVMSTGAATMREIHWAVEELATNGASHICLLHCVLNYPTPAENAKLNEIRTLQQAFPNLEVGYSDHVVADDTLSALEAATLLGATVLEKHFTYDKSLKGNDHYHAMDEHDLKKFVKKIKLYQKYYSPGKDKIEGEDLAVANARRSIYAARNLKKGRIITEDDLICKRPGFHLSPIHWDSVIGSTLLDDLNADEPVTTEILKNK